MRKLFAVAIAVPLLAVGAGVFWPERAEPAPAVRCSRSDPDISISVPAFIAWGRTGVVLVRTGYGPGIVTDAEVSLDGGATFRPFEDLGGLRGISVRMPRRRSAMHVVFRWQQHVGLQDPVAKTCDLTIAGGLGRVGPLRFRERDGGIAIFWFSPRDPITTECAEAARLPATLTVSSGPARARLTVADQCYSGRVQRSAPMRNWRLFANVDGIAFQALGRKPARQAFSFTLRIGSSLTQGRFLVTRQFYPGGRIWQGTDNFVNICLGHAYPIRSAGGRLYCIQPALLTFRVRRTK